MDVGATGRGPRAIVVMGVSGCGKSTLAAALAQDLAWTFVEGDLLHPPENVRKMAAGIPLTDEDRRPFLLSVAEALAANPAGAVASCSALKRSYRNLIRAHVGDLLFVLPTLSRDELAARLANRPGHFMPAALLDSQIATLELPDHDEPALLIDGLLLRHEQVRLVREVLDA